MKVIACMSGTSLDGLDVAFCEFGENKGVYSYKIINAKTFNYNDTWKRRLQNSMSLSAKDLLLLDNDFGIFVAEQIKDFISCFNIKDYDCVASHGHTVYHEPHLAITKQIGNGLYMAFMLNKPVVYDFRSFDVALGGQGAPLVPIGDKLLFNEFDYCLNIGGFSNVSLDDATSKRIAFDIAPANIIANDLVKPLGIEYDNNGDLGRAGELIDDLLIHLNSIPYYNKPYPKSLGKEWVEKNISPKLKDYDNVSNLLRTLYEHIAVQVGSVLKGKETKTLITGGGAYNKFLIEKIKEYSESELIIPESNLIEFKEALIFGFLAYLKLNNKNNTLASVTGACRDSSGGLIVYP
jgi:anhydro-N-acetylmuramic acid kinase